MTRPTLLERLLLLSAWLSFSSMPFRTSRCAPLSTRRTSRRRHRCRNFPAAGRTADRQASTYPRAWRGPQSAGHLVVGAVVATAVQMPAVVLYLRRVRPPPENPGRIGVDPEDSSGYA